MFVSPIDGEKEKQSDHQPEGGPERRDEHPRRRK